MFSVPDRIVVRRPITLNGALVPAGTSLSKEQVIDLGHELNALLDSGYVTALADPYARKGRPRPEPTSLPPVIRKAMLAKMSGSLLSVTVAVAGDAISVSVVGGRPSFTVTLDGASPQSKGSRTFAFTAVASGTYTIEVTDGSGATASAVAFVDTKPVVLKKATVAKA